MKEIVCTFHTGGDYLPDKPAVFEEDTCLRLIIQPHDFELKLSGETLRSSSCAGYTIEVSNNGAVSFYSTENGFIKAVPETQNTFPEVRLSWKQDELSVNFGRVETIDNYPNCDGEYDRWDEKWVSEYTVRLDTASNQTETCVPR